MRFMSLFWNTILNIGQKRMLPLLIIGSLLFSLFEAGGIGLLWINIEFLTKGLTEQSISVWMLKYIPILTEENFYTLMGMGLILFFIIRMVYMTFFTFFQYSYTQSIFRNISKRLMYSLLNQSYQNYLKNNTSEYKRSLVMDVNSVSSIAISAIQVAAELFTLLCIGGFLFYQFPQTIFVVSLIVVVFFGVSYISTFDYIRKLGSEKNYYLGKIIKSLDEIFSNFKLHKIDNTESYAVNKLSKYTLPYSKTQIKYGTVQSLPRVVFETVGFIGITVALLFNTISSTNIEHILKEVTILLIAIMRIVPSINRVILALNTISFATEALFKVAELLNLKPEISGRIENKVDFKRLIEVKDLSFSFVKNKSMFRHLNFRIEKSDKIGIIGASGNGKSTLMDLLLGFLSANAGQILIDGTPLNKTGYRSWRSLFGYIPQSVFLYDSNVAENICNGLKKREMRLNEVIDKAMIKSVLENREGLETEVGENGVQLSGGQKQRIGIARALYKNPEVIIMDEATSALDLQTEANLIDEIFDAAIDKTLIIISHRKETLRKCNKLFSIENYQIKPIEKSSLYI
ncbi:MAG: ABC transporter ATP-binding protein [Oligoflexales bacterium]